MTLRFQPSKEKKISNTTFKSTKNKHNIKWDETTWGH